VTAGGAGERSRTPIIRDTKMSGATQIRANTILPAHRKPIRLQTDDGLTLVGELASPLEHVAVATLVTLHPLPTHGGMMDSHVLRKAAWRLPALADLAVLRFNTRGTTSAAGSSEGVFDHGEAERFDVEAAIRYAMHAGLPHPWLVGWSFGADLAVRFGLEPGIEGAVLLSPPLRAVTDVDLDRWAVDGRDMVALVPELDDYLRPTEARARLTRVPQAEVVAFAGARHLWVGETHVRAVLDEITRRLAPSSYPLPSTWSGAYETSDG
jgi:alpha/beta superfamily hydrolase